MTVREFVDKLNGLSSEEVAQAMESLPTDALEWAVKFEALSHKSTTEENKAQGAGGAK